MIRLNTAGQLGLGERCLQVVTGPAGDPEISVEVCSLGSVSGPWSYSPADLTVRFSLSEEPRQLCVQMRGLGGLLTLAQCDPVTFSLPACY